MPTILVTDAWVGKTLSAIRSLGEAGYDVHAISHTYNSFGFYSKYTKKHFKFPNPQEQPDAYRIKLLELLAKNKYDCIIPMEDAVIKIILEVREEVERLTHVALPLRENYYAAYSKLETLQLAETIGVPIPQTWYSPSVEELKGQVDDLPFPLIIKPISGSGSRGLKKVKTAEELFKFYPEIVAHYGPCLVQHALPQEGKGLGVGLIAKDGNVLCSYSYTRLREFPVTGGPGTLREVTDDAATQAYAAKLMHSLNWTGVAMVEFKTDAYGQPKLMEINPRFWGSLELARYAGVNLPKMVVQLSLGEKVEPQTATVGTRARWLIPGDIAHFVFNPKRFSMQPSFFNFGDKNTHTDHLQWRDFKGSMAFLICSFLQFFSPKIWRMAIFRK